MQPWPNEIIASVYGDGTYNSGVYSSSTSNAQSSGNSSGSGSSTVPTSSGSQSTASSGSTSSNSNTNQAQHSQTQTHQQGSSPTPSTTNMAAPSLDFGLVWWIVIIITALAIIGFILMIIRVHRRKNDRYDDDGSTPTQSPTPPTQIFTPTN